MPYLLDTNVWIHYLKHPGTPIHAKLATLQPDDVVTCSIVRSELLHGAEKYGDRNRRVAIVNQTLAPSQSLPFDDEDAFESAMRWKRPDLSSARTTFRLRRFVCVTG